MCREKGLYSGFILKNSEKRPTSKSLPYLCNHYEHNRNSAECLPAQAERTGKAHKRRRDAAMRGVAAASCTCQGNRVWAQPPFRKRERI